MISSSMLSVALMSVNTLDGAVLGAFLTLFTLKEKFTVPAIDP
jgi:hypothetical protein